MAKIPNKITLTLERLQSIYDELRPVAYQNRLDGNLTEEQLNDASIDCCLTDIDLIKWQGSSPGFAFSGIWYGNPELLKDIYAKAVELDEADGHLDGQISMGEGRTGLTFHTGSEKTAENDWRGIITPYKMGIFTITVTFGHDPNESTGTAWVIEREGLGNGMYRYWVITNAHVVDRYDDDETSHKIRLTDDGIAEEIALNLHGVDHIYDVGVLSFDSRIELPVLPLGLSDTIREGEPVVVVGNQLSEGIVTTDGSINSPKKYTNYKIMPLIQDDSAALGGNSGSPLFNKKGHVIGVTFFGNMEGGQNLNIPIPLVYQSFQDIKNDREFSIGTTHVIAQMIDKSELESQRIEGFVNALYISKVLKGSKADLAGLRRGDIVVKYDDKKMPIREESARFWYYLAGKKDGDVVTLTVYRDSSMIELQVPVEMKSKKRIPTLRSDYGYVFKEVGSWIKARCGFEPTQEGVLAQDEDDDYPPKMLVAINGFKVGTLEDLRRILREARTIKLTFQFLAVDGELELETVSNKNLQYLQ